ncbi:hypothetical protein ABZ626_38500, partial [Streptomyces longispororuber]|uniref:hypothetical protein n=1 Tax=Streptomyces longispororuber TaxID=68230 RepID=UPI003404FAAE
MAAFSALRTMPSLLPGERGTAVPMIVSITWVKCFSARFQSGSASGPPRSCLIIDLVVGRGELTDAAWDRIAPMLPGV